MKILNGIRKIERWIVVIGLGLMTAITIYSVFNRFILKSAITWSDEATRYLFIWVSLIGACIGVEEKAHVGVSLFVDMMPEGTRRFVSVLSNAFCLLFCGVLVYTGITLVSAQSNQYSAALRINMAYIYSAIPVSFALMGLEFFKNIVDVIRDDNMSLDENKEVLG